MSSSIKIGMLFKVDSLLFKNRTLKIINYAKFNMYKYKDIYDNSFTGTIEPSRMILLNEQEQQRIIVNSVKLPKNYKRLSNKELIKLVTKKDKQAIKEFVIRYKKLPNLK